jgi:hypothetical protein
MAKLRLFTGAAAIATIVAVGAAAATSGTTAPGYSARVDNPWYPLKPGTTYTYRGVKDGKPSRDVFSVTHRTTTVDGAPCVVVTDRLYLSGYLEERTTEWFSQDKQGNVWYFGEKTATLDKKGRVTSTSGAWRAGVKGAKPGIFMFAHPTVGRAAQQEFFKGAAEDHFQVLSLHADVHVPYVSSTQAILTKEWTPLEPGVIDHKLYVRGIGTVLEQTVTGGNERNALVSVTH